MSSWVNSIPQAAPGTNRNSIHHGGENSIPLSIFPMKARDKYCFAFCGKPARGKTHIASRLARYLEFFHLLPVQIFNVAEYRRTLHGSVSDAAWFDSANSAGVKIREECNRAAISAMVDFLNSHDDGVAVLDSTNSTYERRKKVVDAVDSAGAKLIWIEVSSTITSDIDQHIEEVVKGSPDYKDVEYKLAQLDYRKRLEKYEILYETLDDGKRSDEGNWSYFKCDHGSHRFTCHKVRGHLPLKVVHFIMNLRNSPHAFYLTRHGQSIYNVVGRIGGDSGLSEYGVEYAKKLAEFVEEKITHDSEGNDVPARLWTSTMNRTCETAQFIKHDKIMVIDKEEGIEFQWLQMRQRRWHHLDELFAGQCDGMTYKEIEIKFPCEFESRQKDKLAYRYPRGESYLDVIARLEPIIIEMERHREPLLIIAHQAVLRIVYAFYCGLSREEAPYVSIPLNTVVEMAPSPFGCRIERHVLYKPPELKSDGQDEPVSVKASNGNDIALSGLSKQLQQASIDQMHLRDVDPPSH